MSGGVPQGTKCGLLLFVCMINDLQPSDPILTIKFVDDTTLLEIIKSKTKEPHPSYMQFAFSEVRAWTERQNMKINPPKLKEMITNFSKHSPQVEPVHVDGSPVSQVTNAKLLGVTISHDLKWDIHVKNITRSASSRLYYLIVLKRCRAPTDHLLKIYLQRIRPVLEYACQSWHPGLTKDQTRTIEHVQKRALSIIFPKLTYTDALKTANLTSLEARRQRLCQNYFEKLKSPTHKLHSLLPKKRPESYDLRDKSMAYEPPKLRTLRARGSFINWALFNLQK